MYAGMTEPGRVHWIAMVRQGGLLRFYVKIFLSLIDISVDEPLRSRPHVKNSCLA